VRVRLDYTETDGFLGGSRFYLSYSNSAPTATNCNTLASDIATAWNTDIASLMSTTWALTEVDVLDISSLSGASGLWQGSHAGTDSNSPSAAQVSVNVEYKIARRYRGGKPRMFLPPATDTQRNDLSHWSSGYISSVNTGVAAFFAAIEALSVGAMGTLAHVNLSYYKGFTNIANSSGRERAVPTYRTSALLDTVTGYTCKAQMGSQKRRRNATNY
jgi:hypothetical protein